MIISINTFLFTSPFNNANVALFPKFKQWGFDAVEIALENASDIDPVLVKKALDDNGLVCASVCAAMGDGRDLRGTDEEQQTSLEYIRRLIDVLPALNCPLLAGPLYSCVGRAEAVEETAYKAQWNLVVKHLKGLAEYAAQKNVQLAIEPLNRFETDFINTCEQALQMVNEVNHPALGLHLDTFHMNIEEKSLPNAIIKAGSKLVHLHACGSDRGTPGGDHTDWEGIRAALRQINYEGAVAIESFTQDVKVIAKAASIWRKFESSQEDIAVKGQQFLRNLLGT